MKPHSSMKTRCLFSTFIIAPVILRWPRVVLPPQDFAFIAVRRTRLGLLRRQAQPRQQHSQPPSPPTSPQTRARLTRRQPCASTRRRQIHILSRVLAMDPAIHLSLLRGGQRPWSSGCSARGERAQALALPTHRRQPLVDRGTAKTVRGNHLRRGFPITHSFNRHKSDFLQRLMIKCATVAFHEERMICELEWGQGWAPMARLDFDLRVRKTNHP